MSSKEKRQVKANFLMEMKTKKSMEEFCKMYPEEYVKIRSHTWWHDLENKEEESLWMLVCFLNRRSFSAIELLFRFFVKKCYMYGGDIKKHGNRLAKTREYSCTEEDILRALSDMGEEIAVYEPPKKNIIKKEENEQSENYIIKKEEEKDCSTSLPKVVSKLGAKLALSKPSEEDIIKKEEEKDCSTSLSKAFSKWGAKFVLCEPPEEEIIKKEENEQSENNIIKKEEENEQSENYIIKKEENEQSENYIIKKEENEQSENYIIKKEEKENQPPENDTKKEEGQYRKDSRFNEPLERSTYDPSSLKKLKI